MIQYQHLQWRGGKEKCPHSCIIFQSVVSPTLGEVEGELILDGAATAKFFDGGGGGCNCKVLWQCWRLRTAGRLRALSPLFAGDNEPFLKRRAGRRGRLAVAFNLRRWLEVVRWEGGAGQLTAAKHLLMAGRLRALSPPSAGNGEPLGGGGQGYGWMEAAGASDLAFMVLHRRRERATSVRTSSNGGLCGTKIPCNHTAAIGFGRKCPPRPAGGLGRSAITLDMGDIGTLPARGDGEPLPRKELHRKRGCSRAMAP